MKPLIVYLIGVVIVNILARIVNWLEENYDRL